MQVTIGSGPEVYYRRYGRGQPMLVMHGGPGLDHSYFRPALDVLAHAVELIYYDHSGNGRSSDREGIATKTFETWADEAEQLRQALHLPPWVVLGHGVGGCIAQLYAKKYPQAIRGLVLCSTTPVFDYPEHMIAQAHARATPKQMQALMASMTRPMASDIEFRQTWWDTLPLFFYRFQPDHGMALADGIQYHAKAYNRGMFELAPYFNSLGWLGEISTPSLVLAGAHDWMSPRTYATDRLHQTLQHSSLNIFENSGHYPFIEETTAFCHTVRQFIRQLPQLPDAQEPALSNAPSIGSL